MIATAEWVATMRDSSLAVTFTAGALVSLAAAARLPFIRVPIHYVARALFGPAAEAYWGRVRKEAAAAVSPDVLALTERLGDLGATVSILRDDAYASRLSVGDMRHALDQALSEIADLIERVTRIESSCSSLPHIEARAHDIARHTGTDRRSEDP